MSTQLDQLERKLRDGDRRTLARAITLVESERVEDKKLAAQLLDQLAEPPSSSMRLGVSGVPGGGKSTLIEVLGNRLLDQGRRLAVLTIDPSSQRSGGSILGDKTRMPRLASRKECFVRPSPSGGTLGGLARHTRETILLCEHAGYDTVIIETVGVGQSEALVAQLIDFLVLLHLPSSGDELQGMKRGVLELADAVFINKSDLDPQAAKLARDQLSSVLAMQRPRPPSWRTAVLCGSALTGEAIDQLWSTVLRHHREFGEADRARHRNRQNSFWLRELVEQGLWQLLSSDPRLCKQWSKLQQDVASGLCDPASAARQILAALQPDR